MAVPIVFISRFRILEGRRTAFESMFAHAIDLIHSTKPRTALYAAFVDETGTQLRIVHAFPDAGAMTIHFEGSDERSQSLSDLMVPAGFEVYGSAPEAAVDLLRREAAASGVELTLLSETLGGFLRAGI